MMPFLGPASPAGAVSSEPPLLPSFTQPKLVRLRASLIWAICCILAMLGLLRLDLCSPLVFRPPLHFHLFGVTTHDKGRH